MKKIELYELCIRVFGLFLFYAALYQLSLLSNYVIILLQPLDDPFNEKVAMYSFLIQASTFILFLTFAILFIFRAKFIANLICGGDCNTSFDFNANNKAIYQLALIITGLLLITYSLPDLIAQLINHIRFVQNNPPLANDRNLAFIFADLLKLSIASATIWYSGKIASYFDRSSMNKASD